MLRAKDLRWLPSGFTWSWSWVPIHNWSNKEWVGVARMYVRCLEMPSHVASSLCTNALYEWVGGSRFFTPLYGSTKVLFLRPARSAHSSSRVRRYGNELRVDSVILPQLWCVSGNRSLCWVSLSPSHASISLFLFWQFVFSCHTPSSDV